eukprot:jgi/Botrbrau1/22771/Bobra.0132s0101.1
MPSRHWSGLEPAAPGQAALPSWLWARTSSAPGQAGSEKTMKPNCVWAAARSPCRGHCSYVAAGAREPCQAKCTPLVGCGLDPAQGILQLCGSRLKGTPSDRSCRPLVGAVAWIPHRGACRYAAAGSQGWCRTRCTPLHGKGSLEQDSVSLQIIASNVNARLAKVLSANVPCRDLPPQATC